MIFEIIITKVNFFNNIIYNNLWLNKDIKNIYIYRYTRYIP